jgi:hypothetical protein
MKRWVFDGFLILVVLVGGVLAWQAGRERSRLMQHYERLTRKLGDLPISDRSKLHLLALETGDPLHFAWRAYLPANYNLMLSDGSGSSWGTSIGSSESIFRVRFRRDKDGDVQVYTRIGGTSSQNSFGDESLQQFLRDRWDRVRVERLASPDVAVVGADESAVLLRLTLPDDLAAEARKTLSPEIQQQYVPVLYQLNLGTTPPPP